MQNAAIEEETFPAQSVGNGESEGRVRCVRMHARHEAHTNTAHAVLADDGVAACDDKLLVNQEVDVVRRACDDA